MDLQHLHWQMLELRERRGSDAEVVDMQPHPHVAQAPQLRAHAVIVGKRGAIDKHTDLQTGKANIFVKFGRTGLDLYCLTVYYVIGCFEAHRRSITPRKGQP